METFFAEYFVAAWDKALAQETGKFLCLPVMQYMLDIEPAISHYGTANFNQIKQIILFKSFNLRSNQSPSLKHMMFRVW